MHWHVDDPSARFEKLLATGATEQSPRRRGWSAAGAVPTVDEAELVFVVAEPELHAGGAAGGVNPGDEAQGLLVVH